MGLFALDPSNSIKVLNYVADKILNPGLREGAAQDNICFTLLGQLVRWTSSWDSKIKNERHDPSRFVSCHRSAPASVGLIWSIGNLQSSPAPIGGMILSSCSRDTTKDTYQSPFAKAYPWTLLVEYLYRERLKELYGLYIYTVKLGTGQLISRHFISRPFVLMQVTATRELGLGSGLVFGSGFRLGLGLWVSWDEMS